jgi:hypothetical protein
MMMLGWLAVLLPAAVWAFVCWIAPAGKITQGRGKGRYVKEFVEAHTNEVVSIEAASSNGRLARFRGAVIVTWKDGRTSLADVDSTTYVLLSQRFEALASA